MTINFDILRTARALSRHAEQRQVLIANNIANADTPGYKARDLPPFAQVFGDGPQVTPLRITRAGHIQSTDSGALFQPIDDTGAEAAPNGNNVSLEREMTKAARTRQEYDMAMGIYFKSLDILRASLGR